MGGRAFIGPNAHVNASRRNVPIMPNSIVEHHFIEPSGQVLVDARGLHHAQLGSTTGADANDPTFNQQGYFDYGANDGCPAPLSLNADFNRSNFSVLAVGKWPSSADYSYLLGEENPGVGPCLIYTWDTTKLIRFVVVDTAATHYMTDVAVHAYDTWYFVAGVYEASTRITHWNTRPGSLTKVVEKTVGVGTIADPIDVRFYVGSDPRFTLGNLSHAFLAICDVSISDSDMQNLYYPRVKGLMAQRGIALP